MVIGHNKYKRGVAQPDPLLGTHLVLHVITMVFYGTLLRNLLTTKYRKNLKSSVDNLERKVVGTKPRVNTVMSPLWAVRKRVIVSCIFFVLFVEWWLDVVFKLGKNKSIVCWYNANMDTKPQWIARHIGQPTCKWRPRKTLNTITMCLRLLYLNNTRCDVSRKFACLRFM